MKQSNNVDDRVKTRSSANQHRSSSTSRPSSTCTQPRRTRKSTETKHIGRENKGALCNRRKRQKKHQYFQFQNLPVVCQINVFWFLDDFEKCQAATVCGTWAKLIRTPSLWTQADFTQIPAPHVNIRDLYYREEVFYNVLTPEDLFNDHLEMMSCRYINSLISRKAALHILKFKFDIIEKDGVWMRLLERCLTNTFSKGLTVLECDWSQTVLYREYCRATLWYKMKRRPHIKEERTVCFQQFLGILHRTSPNILSIHCPFDWSSSSVIHITRFAFLKELNLTRYWALHGMEQQELTDLLQNLIHLEKLSIEVWIPIQRETHHLKIASKSLKYLDIRECLGFYLSELDLPNLEVLREVKFYVGPLILSETLNVRCLLEVLRTGAPLLNMLNELKLLPTWKEGAAYERLSEELNRACLCTVHTKSSIIY